MCKTPIAKARKLAKRLIDASKDPLNYSSYFGRKFDSLLEDGDGEDVVIEFIKLYNKNKELQKATQKANRWIPIENWLKTYQRWKEKNPSLF